MKLSDWKKINYFLLFFVFFQLTAEAQIISEVRFINLRRTKYSYMRDYIVKSKKNELFDSVKAHKDVQELYNLRHFEDVKYQLVPIDSGKYELHFIFKETLSLFPIADAGLTKDFLRFQAGFIDFNSFGRTGYSTLYVRQFGRLNYGFIGDYPFVLGKRNGFTVELLKQGSYEPIWVNNKRNEYNYDLYTALAMWRYDFNLRSFLRIGGAYQYEIFSTYKNFNLDSGLYLNSAEAERGLIRVNYRYQKINLERVTQRGVYFDINYTHIIPTVEKNFLYGNSWKVLSDFRYYFRPFRYSNIAARLRLGYGKSALFDQFVLDDNTNIRGIGFKRVRRDFEFVLNIENRQTIFTHPKGIVQAVVFNDFSPLNNHSGFGLRVYAEPLHGIVFRFDYGFANTDIKNGGVVAGIHQYF